MNSVSRRWTELVSLDPARCRDRPDATRTRPLSGAVTVSPSGSVSGESDVRQSDLVRGGGAAVLDVDLASQTVDRGIPVVLARYNSPDRLVVRG